MRADEYADQGAGLCEAMAAQANPEEEILGINEAFAVPIIAAEGHTLEKPLIVEFDMRVRKNGQPLILDWKTSARRWPKYQAGKSLQPTAYGYTHRHVYGENADMRFDIAVKNKTPVIEQHRTRRDYDHYGRMVVLITRMERMIQASTSCPASRGSTARAARINLRANHGTVNRRGSRCRWLREVSGVGVGREAWSVGRDGIRSNVLLMDPPQHNRAPG